VGEDQLVAGGEGVELVRGAAEVLARQAADLRSDLFGKACGGVQPRADGRAAKRKLPQRRKRQPDQLRIALEAAAPAGDLLRERNGRGILQMGAPGLDDALIFGLEALERVDQLRQRGQDAVLERADSRNMQGRGERVVRGLRAVDVIIRVQQLPAHQLVAAVRDDLVHVHVRLRAGAGLPDDEREVA